MTKKFLYFIFKFLSPDLIKAIQQFWFDCLTKGRLKLIEINNKIESDIEREERFKPIYQEKEIDEKLQTGESRKLGGEMRLAAKWVVEAEAELESKRPGE